VRQNTFLRPRWSLASCANAGPHSGGPPRSRTEGVTWPPRPEDLVLPGPGGSNGVPRGARAPRGTTNLRRASGSQLVQRLGPSSVTTVSWASRECGAAAPPVPSGRGRLRCSGPSRPGTDRPAGHGKVDPYGKTTPRLPGLPDLSYGLWSVKRQARADRFFKLHLPYTAYGEHTVSCRIGP